MSASKKIKKAMVLGGEGQIGKPLCEYLKTQGVKVFNVDLLHGPTEDLRTTESTDSTIEYWLKDADFVFFLAYDIGGAKFLKTEQGKYEFLMNNTKIMANTFSLLQKHNKPFIFASSAMAEMPWSPYGDLKRLGEHFTQSLGGITTRFWNVYGPEHDEMKAHVITDFIRKARDTGHIDMMTDGTEVRQFLYTEDCSHVLYTLAQNFDKARLSKKFDVTTHKWTSVLEIANIIAEHYGAKVTPAPAKDTVQNDSQIQPESAPLDAFWKYENAVTVPEGIQKMIAYYEEEDKNG